MFVMFAPRKKTRILLQHNVPEPKPPKQLTELFADYHETILKLPMDGREYQNGWKTP